jgi:hypothetical protein
MAAGALSSRRSSLVVMMVCSVEPGGVMALRANGIAGEPKLAGMGFMTVRARHACCVHLALQEGAKVENLVPLLSIGVIERRLKPGCPEGVEEFFDPDARTRELLAA